MLMKNIIGSGRAGDRNTKFFHSVTKARRIRNRISVLLDENGNSIHGDRNIANTAEEFFKTQFSSQQQAQMDFGDSFDGFVASVTPEINTDLTRPVTIEEIRQAAYAIGAHKAPGPDGFTASFYHTFWEDIEQSIVKDVTQFFDGEFLDQNHNHTNICLIPKVRPATKMTEFRPIALCNVSYKIISKILVKRLKTHLPNIISENQTAFTPGRNISDNVIIAQEAYHALKVSKRISKSYMALKTDITKAYDRLEWNFLEETMRRMGFCDKWINLIMLCVKSVSFSVLINGSPSGYIKPERGIRQGDPLSPYLFILCANVLFHLMNKAAAERKIQGMKISIQSPTVSHLLFADDSLFFTLANLKNGRAIKKILSQYERISGQSVNLSKSAITFGSRVKDQVKTQMRHLLAIHNDGGGGKYLGVPEQFGRKKTENLEYITAKVKAKINGWHQKFLSSGGKEVLTKSIASAMPVYPMNVFKFPKKVCDDINNTLALF